MSEVLLQCQCKKVEGRILNVSPKDGTRVSCYCKDCQAFAQALHKQDSVLDEFGGTDIYQASPARVKIEKGQEHVSCLRLTEQGLYRWYAGCCNTPIANTLSPDKPFVGLIHSFIADTDKEAKLGQPQARANLRGATARIPDSMKLPLSERRYVWRILSRILWWKLSGQGKPNPFFKDDKPVVAPKILG
ncbi:DUF6151 family protein [Alteromonas sp. a30]|uniref:DUF6151 family protein n=1 Tax=Alteromonas sp. a30 TaxID=2730917 RepID=UPI00228205BC|nr:DUF6151 family protein [Alteromonas sp. a30]MCY7296764.1 hypothetical protein [Alteromonas sp. a30]